MTKIELSMIKWEPAVYPRSKWSTATIERYADAMEAGEVFPALTLQDGTNILLDGKHRLEAYKKAGIKEVPVDFVKIPDGVPIRLFAASLSARHGDRMSNGDLKDIVREVYTENPEYKGKDVAKLLSISEGTVSGFVSDILAKRREDRRAKALRLSMLGWTQEEIAERLGVDRTLISKDVKNFNTEEFHIFDSGHTPEDIALRLGLPVQVVLAIQYEKMTDQQRMAGLKINIQPYDVWHFPGCHDLMGDKHPGRIPGELVCHVLYFYTKPGDLVVDPMAGSGTTLDACLLMGRKARGYDIDEHHNRIDIEKHDLSEGWPDSAAKARLIFWDPPYFDKMDDGYVDGSISGLEPEAYLKWLAKSFKSLSEIAKPESVLAFLMSDWDPENAKKHGDSDGIFLWDYVRELQKAGWKIKRQIQVPLSTQQVHPDIVNKFRESRRLARLGRYLLIGEK